MGNLTPGSLEQDLGVLGSAHDAKALMRWKFFGVKLSREGGGLGDGGYDFATCNLLHTRTLD